MLVKIYLKLPKRESKKNQNSEAIWAAQITQVEQIRPDQGGRATLIVARAHILSRPRVMCSQVRML